MTDGVRGMKGRMEEKRSFDTRVLNPDIDDITRVGKLLCHASLYETTKTTTLKPVTNPKTPKVRTRPPSIWDLLLKDDPSLARQKKPQAETYVTLIP